MNRHQHIRWTALAMTFALAVASCGGDDDDDATSDTTATTAAASTTESTAATDTTTAGEETTTTAAPVGEPEEAPGFDGQTITLGVLTPQTGIAAVIGNPLTIGNQVFVDALNAAGGIAGKYKVELKIGDTKYDPPTAVQQYNAIKDDVTLFVQSLGTAITNALLPQLKADNIVASPATLDAFWVPEQNLIPILGPYQIQAINALSWYVDEGGGAGKRICTLRQDDPYGDAGLEGVEFAAADLGITLGADPTFKPGDQDFTAQVSALQGDGCDMVFLTALPTETLGIMAAAAKANFTPQWIGQSPTWVFLLAQGDLAPYTKDHFLLVSEGVEWGDMSNPGMADLIANQKQYAPDQEPNIYFMFGYIQAWAVAQVLEKAVALGDLSREGIINAMNSLEVITFGGLVGDYTFGAPAERVPSRVSTIMKVTPETVASNGGLSVVKANFTTPTAEAYEFDF